MPMEPRGGIECPDANVIGVWESPDLGSGN